MQAGPLMENMFNEFADAIWVTSMNCIWGFFIHFAFNEIVLKLY